MTFPEPVRSSDPVVVLGSINMDLVLELDDLPAAGETVVGRSTLVRPGGKGANQAIAAALAGAPVTMIGRVGDDQHGETVLGALEAAGVDVDRVEKVPGEPTGLAMVMVARDGENAIAVSPGANGTLRPDDVEALGDLLTRDSTLLLQMEVPIDVVVRACEVGADQGATVVLNLAPAVQLPPPVLGLVDVLVVNRAEAGHLLGRPVGVGDAALAASSIRSRGPRAVVLTMGADGALLADRDGTCHVPAKEVEVLDTTGAGDAFVGALVAWMKVDGLRGAMDGATRVAAEAVGVRGAHRSGLGGSVPARQQGGAAQ